MKTFGVLERVDLRDGWKSESAEFTPWLAGEENLRLLGDAIGMELQLEAQEKEVGPFRADILCKDIATGDYVLIENQLERTDHNHLGQLLTYAAGLEAATIVWIAREFTEEHRAALDWLNGATQEEFNFFGLEIELWRIGASPIAPKFNVVCKPNDWSRSIRESKRRDSGQLTDGQELQLEFWTGFNQYVSTSKVHFRCTKPLPQNWMNIALGRSGLQLTAIASTYDTERRASGGEIRAEFLVNHRDSDRLFAVLEAQKAEIEAALGEPLSWYRPEGVRARRAFFRKSVMLADRDSWPTCFAWLAEKLDKLYTVFGPRVRNIELQ